MGNSDNDGDAFKRAMDGVRPIRQDKQRRESPKPPPRARFRRQEDDDVLWESLNGPHDPAEVDSGDESSYRRPGIQPGVLRKLRRGRYAIEGELDLHGLIVPEAAQTLREFIQDRACAGVRCVRVIHGKGIRSGDRGPVLKRRVTRWLRQMDAVLAYATPPPRDGGTGALYVLLRQPQRR